MTIGEQCFPARLESALAPRTCARFAATLPYTASLIQARWSGQAGWIPTGEPITPWPDENVLSAPAPGQVLYYAGGLSEPEILVPYGVTRFACKDGPLRGNHFLTIEAETDRLAELGEALLWKGAHAFRVSHA